MHNNCRGMLGSPHPSHPQIVSLQVQYTKYNGCRKHKCNPNMNNIPMLQCPTVRFHSFCITYTQVKKVSPTSGKTPLSCPVPELCFGQRRTPNSTQLTLPCIASPHELCTACHTMCFPDNSCMASDRCS